VPGGWNEAEWERLKSTWEQRHQGALNAGRIAVLWGDMEWEQAEISAREMQLIEQRRMLRDDLIGTFGVPKSVMGISEDVNRANADAGYFVYAKEVITPRLHRIAATINKFFLPEFGERLEIEFAHIIPDDEAVRTQKAVQGFQFGIMTINEARQTLGLDAIKDGDWILLDDDEDSFENEEGDGAGSAPRVEKPDTVAEPNPSQPGTSSGKAPIGGGAAPAEKMLKNLESLRSKLVMEGADIEVLAALNETIAAAKREISIGTSNGAAAGYFTETKPPRRRRRKHRRRFYVDVQTEKKVKEEARKNQPVIEVELPDGVAGPLTRDAYARHRERGLRMCTAVQVGLKGVEQEMSKALVHVHNRLVDDIVRRLSGRLAVPVIKDTEQYTARDIEDTLADWKAYDGELEVVISKGMADAHQVGMENAAATLGTDFTLRRPQSEAWAREHAGEKVVGIGKTTRNQLSDLVEQYLRSGKNVRDLAEEIDTHLRDNWEGRAETIARTELQFAANEGAVDQYQAEGIQQKQWWTSQDEMVCPVCEDLDGDVVDIDDLFSDGSDSPPAHPNCRCTVLPVVEGAGEAAASGVVLERGTAEEIISLAIAAEEEERIAPKKSKDEVNYVSATMNYKSERCAGCVNYRMGECAVVSGYIEGGAVCDLYEARGHTPTDPREPEKPDSGSPTKRTISERPGLDETANEFRYRLKDSSDCDRIRRIPLKKSSPKVYGLVCFKGGKSTIVALRFPKKEGWTHDSANKWVQGHADHFRAFTDAMVGLVVRTMEESSGGATLVVCRHGATEFDTEEGDAQINGQLSTPLDDEGREEAARLRDRLETEDFDMALASDLPRSMETAEIVAEPHGVMVNPVPALRAWNLGELVGKPINEVLRDQVKELVLHPDTSPEGGESYDTLLNRLTSYYDKVLDGCADDESILVVTHGYNVNLLREWVESGRDLDQMLIDPSRLITERDPIKPGGYIKLQKNKNGEWEVVDEWRTSGGAKVVS
jgi:SPP1 gp7 family putative phage head morphogenesis protein